MRRVKTLAVVAALVASSVASTPGWARTAYQEWLQGRGVYVPSTAHPPELYQFFNGVAAQDGLPVAPPPYYDPYGRAVPREGYGEPAY